MIKIKQKKGLKFNNQDKIGKTIRIGVRIFGCKLLGNHV